jgi:hypothetical protein
MGLFSKVTGIKPCPDCGSSVGTFARSGILCKKCLSYLERAGESLRRVPDEHVAEEPIFGVIAPWIELRSVTAIGRVRGTPTDEELATRKGIRLIRATWPDSCALCSRPPKRSQRVACAVEYPREWGILNIGSRSSVVVADVPHCETHAGGATLGRFELADSGALPLFGLRFRWLGYRNAFLRLNRWEWSPGVPAQDS